MAAMAEDGRDHEERISHLEERVDGIAEDATAARHLAAGADRDLSDLGIKVDANRKAINALGLQTAGRFDEVFRRFDAVDQRFDAMDQRFGAFEERVELRFDEMDRGFLEVRGRLDAAAAGQEQIVGLLTRLIDDERS